MENLIIETISIALAVYLVMAMLLPEKFQPPMNTHQWLELALYLGALVFVTKPLGLYINRGLNLGLKNTILLRFENGAFGPGQKLRYSRGDVLSCKLAPFLFELMFCDTVS
jgi:K+-transporting ATPase KdpF subunit